MHPRPRGFCSYKEDALDRNSIYMLGIFIVFIGLFYFMGMRPQQKQRRAHQELMASLKKGDQVMTASGIYGTVKRVEDTVVVIEIAKGVTVKVVRRAIADIIRDSAQAKATAPEATSINGPKKGSSAADAVSYDDAESDGAAEGDEGAKKS
jgi:preprotein translocase subunit YajC